MAEQMALLIADIGGYTRFMKHHRFSLAHAQELVASLLEAVIDAAKPFKLAKLEGDAAFLYAPKQSLTGAALVSKVLKVRQAFLQKQQQLEMDRMCNCDGCMQVGQLTLKFVSHQGEAAFQKVKRLVELAGVDVILVHRMLKNDVPVPEYLLMTSGLEEGLDAAQRPLALRLEHEFEGLGPTTTHYLDLRQLPTEPPPPVRPSLFRKLALKLSFEGRSLPYLLGVKKACEGFRNVEVVSGAPPGPR